MKKEIIRMYEITECGDSGMSTTLAYAKGNLEDIKKFYELEGNPWRRINEVEIQINYITPESVGQKQKAIKEKTDLEKRLNELNELIG